MFSYYAWTPHPIFYFCIFLSITHPTSPLLSRVWERPDWACFGDALSLPFQRSSDPYGRAVGSVLNPVRPNDG